MNTELELYKFLGERDGLLVPRLVRAIENRELSPYRFGIVTRLHGVLLGSIERSLRSGDYEQVLRSVGRLAGVWHSVRLGPETGFLGPLS